MPWPALRNYNDDDIWSIVAYLRSVKPVRNPVPAPEGPIVDGEVDWSSAYANLQPLPSYPAENEIEVTSNDGPGLPDGEATRDQVLQGRYFVTSSGCIDCHNRGVDDPNDPLWLAGFTEGTAGQPFMIGPFKTYAANLTPDEETGLGSWSAEDIFNALRNGKNIEDRFLAPPMPWPVTRNLTDDDLWSIVAYLRSIEPVNNAVPASEGPIVNGEVDWSSAYADLQPLPPYPAGNEIEVE
jgi:mono/diheme cytochrome c family protein